MCVFYYTWDTETSFLKDKWCDVDSCCILSTSASAIKQDTTKNLLPLRLLCFLSSPPHIAFTHHYLYRIHIEPCRLPLCIAPSWMSTSSMQRSIAGAANMPLCLCGWHVAVGVGWLSHCHSLDVMRKSTLDLPLWSALLENPRELSPHLVWAHRSQQRAPDTREAAYRPEPLSSSQTGAIKFSPHYLRQSHHRLVLAGEGKGEERGGVGVTPKSVYMCVFY